MIVVVIDHEDPPHDPLHGFRNQPVDLVIDDQSHHIDVDVQARQGPPLILLHELPGLSEKTFRVGRFFVDQGFRVVMPRLLGWAGQDNLPVALLQVCVRRELRRLCCGADRAVVRQIRQLAAREWRRYPGMANGASGVAVVGKCFTGSLVLALRFEKDWICRPAHFHKLEQALAACPAQSSALIVHELEGRGHSTLVYDYDPHRLRRDLRSTSHAPIDARQAVSRFINNQMGLPSAFGSG